MTFAKIKILLETKINDRDYVIINYISEWMIIV